MYITHPQTARHPGQGGGAPAHRTGWRKFFAIFLDDFFFLSLNPLVEPYLQTCSIDGEVCGSKRPKEKWPKNDFSLWEQSRVWVVFPFLSLGAGVAPTVAGAVSHQEQTLTRTVTMLERPGDARES